MGTKYVLVTKMNDQICIFFFFLENLQFKNSEIIKRTNILFLNSCTLHILLLIGKLQHEFIFKSEFVVPT